MAGELDNLNDDEISDDALSKLINGEMKLATGKKRVAHEANDTEEILDIKSTYILQKYEKNPDKVTKESTQNVEPPSEPVKETLPEGTKKKKERRRVTFSAMEEVKVIVPAQEVEIEQEPTIQIKFHHAPKKFHPDPPKENILEDDPKFAHPGEFSKFVSSIKSPTETKSILKSKGTSKPKKSISFKPSNDDEEKDEFESILKQQTVIGDVIEHKNDAMSKPLQENQAKSQKVSKFKEMRSKVK
jgi:hypothetical protein